MMSRLPLPRRMVTVLKGESLLNDAVALLIFSAAVGAVAAPDGLAGMLPRLALAVPGGIVFGIVGARIYILLSRRLAGTLGGTLFEFVATFGAWVIAERLHLSAILTVVALAMTLARYIPERQSPRERVHSYAVWETTVFLLNVLAFLMMGLQARAIVARLDPAQMGRALAFAGGVLAVVIVVRLAWVMLYNRVTQGIPMIRRQVKPVTAAQALVVSWCGMRGLVTLATAIALPASFPGRDLIVLSALAVVLGTLILQGLTLGPLIHRLHFKPDGSYEQDLAATRLALVDAAIGTLAEREDAAARRLREDYQADRALIADGKHPRAVAAIDKLRREGIAAKRRKLAEMRRRDEIDDDVFHAAEQELDWAELAASPPDRFEIREE